MLSSLGFWYERDGYDTSMPRLMGRQAAGEAFLKSLLRNSSAGQLFCVAPSREEYLDFKQRAAAWNCKSDIEFLLGDNPEFLAQAKVIYRPDTGLADMAWLRRFANQRLYSLCGVTHTICTRDVMRQFGQLATAPLQRWDALICTSSAVKTAMERMLGEWNEYLERLSGGKFPRALKLPLIPLGVDARAFPSAAEPLRSQVRAALGIGEGDIVVLYVGRLNFYAKAHAVPMYQAVERAARATGRKLALLQVGWFSQEAEERASKLSAATFCPNVRCLFLDGRDAAIRQQSWSVSDIFVSLSDNIQETFGLTPLEAMAAGLPVICSDWNGYQETVRHEIDGFRAPTTIPPPGAGLELAQGYLSSHLPTDAYLGFTSLATAVDTDAVVQFLVTLITQDELRIRMGSAGRERAQSEFDWPVIIRRYEALWQELDELRRTAPEVAPVSNGESPYPLCDDPFRTFGHYTHRHLSPETVVSLGQSGTPDQVDMLLADITVTFGPKSRVSQDEFLDIVNYVHKVGSTPLARLLEAFPTREASLYRTIGWLLKFGILRKVDS